MMLTPFTAKEPKIFFLMVWVRLSPLYNLYFNFCIFMRRFKLVLFDVFQNLILVYVYGNLPIYDDSTKPSFHSRRTPICMFSAGIHIQLVSIHDYSFLFWVTACIGYSALVCISLHKCFWKSLRTCISSRDKPIL